ncbi:MAG: YicC/YloC family endoribonuclease [Pirellulales bacterium]
MLLSMTGFGEAHHQDGPLSVAVEVRSINNRHLKVSTRIGEGYASLESEVEAFVRQRVRRGTVQISIRVSRAHRPEDFQINSAVLASYISQLPPAISQWAGSGPLGALLSLPGVVEDNSAASVDVEAEWPVIRHALEAAFDRLAAMREQEGRAMELDLKANCQAIAAALDVVERRAPLVGDGYRDRLTERVRKILGEQGVTVEMNDLIREVSIFADRADISEETVRLRSHLDQFAASLAEESAGRKLEFVVQEMFRETNTIGSKANDVEISRQVIEIKTAIERIREMIQNVE